MTATRETDQQAIADALAHAMRSPAIADIYQRRLEQISRHGHTLVTDAHLPVAVLARKVAEYAGSAVDHCGHGHCVPADRLRNARKHIITSAALAIAVIDRIDADLAQLRAEEGQAA